MEEFMNRLAVWWTHTVVLTVALVFSGCAWEDSQGNGDSGFDADGNSTIDDDSGYPPGPYGINFGDTVANFTVSKVLCSGEHGQGRSWSMDKYLGNKGMLVTVHAGW